MAPLPRVRAPDPTGRLVAASPYRSACTITRFCLSAIHGQSRNAVFSPRDWLCAPLKPHIAANASGFVQVAVSKATPPSLMCVAGISQRGASDTALRLAVPNRLRLNHHKSSYSLKIAVSGDECCVHREGSCGYPEVILVEWHAAALLRSFDFGVQIASGRRDRLTR